MSNANIKEQLGIHAAELIKDGMVVGIGTGSTAHCFIDALIKRCHNGLQIKAVATSRASRQQAEKGGIKVLPLNNAETIDITIDGADNIDKDKNLVKGLGGALLREKIVAASSHEFVIIAEASKLCKTLSNFILPVEIAPFGCYHTIEKMEEIESRISLRCKEDGMPFLTDNGNYIIDLYIKELSMPLAELNKKIAAVIGVLETGFFLGMTGRIFVGHDDGSIEIML